MCCLRKMKQSNCDNFTVSETDPETLLTWNIQSMFYFYITRKSGYNK